MLGATVTTQLAPAVADVFEFSGSDVVGRRHHLGEVVEVPTPIPVARGQEQFFLGGEVLVDRAFRVAGRLGDVVESGWDEPFFSENLFGGIQQQRTSALEASLAGPRLHEPMVPQNLTPWSLRYSLVYFRSIVHFGGGSVESMRSTGAEETIL